LLEAQHLLSQVVICYQSVTEQERQRKYQREPEAKVQSASFDPFVSRNFGELDYGRNSCNYFSSCPAKSSQASLV
jgi:hypothetical protein